MGPQVRPATGLRVHEIETAVDDGQPRLAPERVQCLDADQGLEHHESQLSATIYELHPLQSAPWHSLFTGEAAVRSRGAYSWRWSTRACPTSRSSCTSTSRNIN